MKVAVLSSAHMHALSYIAAVRRIAGAQVVGLYDDDPVRGRRVSEEVHTPFFRNRDELLEKCDAVIVCSENVRHKENVLAAARAKKHVLCEKPIATSAADAVEMIRACENAGVKLYIAFPVRYIAAVRQLKELVQSGKLGDVLAIRGTNHGYMPTGWFIDRALSGGGAVMDHTVHVADIMRYILESEVSDVYAQIDNRVHGKDIDDCGILTLTFENGVIATLDPSWSRTSAYPTWGDVTVEVIGTNGTALFDAFAPHVNVYATSAGKGTYDFYGEDMDFFLVKSFLEAISGANTESADGVDGLRAMEVALAAYESAKSGAVVRLERAQVGV